MVSVSRVEAWLSTSKARRSLVVGRNVGISYSICRVLDSIALILGSVSWTLTTLVLSVPSKRRQVSLFYALVSQSLIGNCNLVSGSRSGSRTEKSISGNNAVFIVSSLLFVVSVSNVVTVVIVIIIIITVVFIFIVKSVVISISRTVFAFAVRSCKKMILILVS